jgi:response regulator of citrate/malate metabolism
VQRGKAKLVVNTAKLGEFLSLASEDIDRLSPLLSGQLPESARPMRKTIDYVELKAQYELLLADGTCATKADVARHVGVSRVWVSRVLKGIKKNMGRPEDFAFPKFFGMNFESPLPNLRCSANKI